MFADTLSFTMPDSLLAEGSCDSSSGFAEMDFQAPGYLMRARLERLRNDEFAWVVIDSVAAPPGARAQIAVDLTGCHPCAYRVWTVDAAGNVACYPSNVVNKYEGGTPVGVGNQPATFHLGKVTPSPVRAFAAVPFSLAAPGATSLALYDLSGRRVLSILDRVMGRGPQLVMFDARALPGGVYFVRLKQGRLSSVARIVVLP